jgi:hypothetical protein
MFASVWPWLVIAAAGALHGLNPITGWAFAAWWTGSPSTSRLRRMLAPIAVGHLASVLVVAAAVPVALQLGVVFNPLLPQMLAVGLLVWLLLRHFRSGEHKPVRPASGGALALWSFIVGTGHGAGWMLVPALASVCTSDAPAREITASGSLLLGLAAVGLHMAAMLLVTIAMVAGVQRTVTTVASIRGRLV